jgi:hypothetical protein
MATANLPPGASPVEHHNGSDPFLAPHDAHRQRYSAFDNSHFSLYLNGSPMQAKRALQAHLAETTRRLQETSHLGNALVQQRKKLEDKLQEVDSQQQENDIGPELRQRLAELEKEFNEVGRETARAFLPKSRVPSGETDIGGASVYSSEAHPSPTKISVPSRKQRNQQPSRIGDIALATEISTSLLSQLKDLQAVLLERDEALKAADLDRSQLEIEVEGLSQRLRTLDESESRLKDVNWNLETQVRESETQAKSAADKEHRLNLALSQARTDRSTLERELEELKQMHTKLNDDHINKTKQHETELSSLRRTAAMTETEKGAMLRKVEELTSKNQELAKAVAYRARSEERGRAEDTSPDDGGEEGDSRTPEHSPPPSPNKATPRHGMLESETLKHSLQHAHRMIQQLKNNIHREKTEKIELKRMLQDARDELETTRTTALPGSASKRRKSDKDAFKKPARPDRLGSLRTGTFEILEVEDDEWEEQDGEPSPSKRPGPTTVPGSFPGSFISPAETSAYEGFETANDTSDAAFETANERDALATESDAFQTGAETLDGDSSDQLTETEAGRPRSDARRSRPSFAKGRLDSYESTASASETEYGDRDFRTPLQRQPSRFRLKARDSSSRRSTPRGGSDLFAGTPVSRDSPASYVSSSNENTPAQGKSLFAELNDLSGDEDDGSSVEGSPSRSSVLFSPPQAAAPGQASAVSKPVMVDSGMMTEPDTPQPVTMSSISTQDTQPQAPRVPTLQLSSFSSQGTIPIATPRPDLKLSSLSSEATEPKRVLVPALHFSSVSGHSTSPKSPDIPRLGLSSLAAQGTVPLSPPAPHFGYSALHAQDTAPRAVPIAPLNMSSVSAHTTEPRHVVPPFLGLSAFSSQGTEPVAPVIQRTIPPSLGVSPISHQTTEPREATASSLPVAAGLLTSAISTQSTEPISQTEYPSTARGFGTVSDEMVPEHTTQESRETMQHVPLQLSSVSAHATEPRDVPQKPVSLQMSSVSGHATEPRDVPRPVLSMVSATSTQATEPLAPKRERQQLSQVASHATEPMAPQPPRMQMSTFSSHSTEPMAPQPPRLQLSNFSSHSTEPMAPQPPNMQLSSFSSHSTEPLAPRMPRMQMSNFSSHSTEPVGVPKPAPSQLSSLAFQASRPQEPLRPAPSSLSAVSSQITEPVVPLKATVPGFSMLSSQATEPVQPRQQASSQMSAINIQQTEPTTPVATRSEHQFSDVHTVQDTQPESPTLPAFLPTPTSRPSTANRIPASVLSLSSVATQRTEPLESPRPATAHRTFPPVMASTTSQTDAVENKQSSIPKLGYFDAVLPWHRDTSSEFVTSPAGSREIRMPLTPIDANASKKTPRTPMADGGTQTMVSAEQIDKLLLARNQRWSGVISTAGIEKSLSPPESPSRRYSADPGRTPRRPGSSGSMRSRAATPPPLPPDHKEVIAAASLRPIAPVSPAGTMGPPTLPASAYKKRPYTPTVRTSNNGLTPKTGGTTPRARRQSQRSGASSPLSRMSSLSSFTSEIDQRFNVSGGPSFTPHGVPAGTTDPRMIQAITQTMIGEYLWKYTRKTGREAMSETRHRRFFWIHPYTRTLYWSDRDPQSADKSQLKSKSVAIESVEQVDDPNPLPPGLHQKSLLVHTPGRSMKFTATTGQRHETWYNALNYLCQRVEEGEQQQAPPQLQEEQEEKSEAGDEIADEFNGGIRSSSRQTGRSRASMASYATRTSSRDHTEVPTLRQSPYKQQRALSTEPPVHGSVSSRFSTLLRPSASAMRGSFSSFRSKAGIQDSTAFEEPSNSTMELSRNIHEAVESDQDFMPNVRACCDGKSIPGRS